MIFAIAAAACLGQHEFEGIGRRARPTPPAAAATEFAAIGHRRPVSVAAAAPRAAATIFDPPARRELPPAAKVPAIATVPATATVATAPPQGPPRVAAAPAGLWVAWPGDSRFEGYRQADGRLTHYRQAALVGLSSATYCYGGNCR